MRTAPFDFGIAKIYLDLAFPITRLVSNLRAKAVSMLVQIVLTNKYLLTL